MPQIESIWPSHVKQYKQQCFKLLVRAAESEDMGLKTLLFIQCFELPTLKTRKHTHICIHTYVFAALCARLFESCQNTHTHTYTYTHTHVCSSQEAFVWIMSKHTHIHTHTCVQLSGSVCLKHVEQYKQHGLEWMHAYPTCINVCLARCESRHRREYISKYIYI